MTETIIKYLITQKPQPIFNNRYGIGGVRVVWRPSLGNKTAEQTSY